MEGEKKQNKRAATRRLRLYKLPDNRYAISMGVKSDKAIQNSQAEVKLLAVIYVNKSRGVLQKSFLKRVKKEPFVLRPQPGNNTRTEEEIIEAFKAQNNSTVHKPLYRERILYTIGNDRYAIAHGEISKKRLLEVYPEAKPLKRFMKKSLKTIGLRPCTSKKKSGVTLYKPKSIPITGEAILAELNE